MEPSVEGPVRFDGSDVGIDCISVQGIMFQHLLGEVSRVLELEAPLFDGFDIFIHTLAFVENYWDLKSNDAKFEDALKYRVPASLFKGCDSEFNLGLKIVTVVIACLDLLKVVILGHPVHESSDEIGSQHPLACEKSAVFGFFCFEGGK